MIVKPSPVTQPLIKRPRGWCVIYRWKTIFGKKSCDQPDDLVNPFIYHGLSPCYFQLCAMSRSSENQRAWFFLRISVSELCCWSPYSQDVGYTWQIEALAKNRWKEYVLCEFQKSTVQPISCKTKIYCATLKLHLAIACFWKFINSSWLVFSWYI